MTIRRIIPLLIACLLVACEKAPQDSSATPTSEAPTATARVAHLSLGDRPRHVLGPVVRADALRDALDALPEADIIVLEITCAGGVVSEAPPIIDLLDERDDDTRIVAWVRFAGSAAALVAMARPELVMTPDAALGGVVAFELDDGDMRPLDGDDLEVMLAVGAEVARRGERDPRLIRAMQTPTALSYDVIDGAPVLRDDAAGEHVLTRADEILTFNALDAEAAGVSLGTARSLDDVLTILDVESWERVGESTASQLSQIWTRRAELLTDASATLALLDRLAADLESAAFPENEASMIIAAVSTLETLRTEHPEIARYAGVSEGRLEAHRERAAAALREARDDGGEG